MSDILPSLITLSLCTLVASLLLRSYSEQEKPLLWLSFWAHEVCGVLNVVVVYAVYGWGDLLGYHAMGTFLANKLRGDFLDLAPQLLLVLFQQAPPLPFPGVTVSNTGSMQAMSGFLCFICGNSVYAICLLIAGISFVAKLAMYNAFKRLLPEVKQKLLIFGCLLVPSAVFWSTGLLKEPIAVIGVGAMVYGGHQLVSKGRFASGLAWLGVGALLAGLFKGYLLPPFGIGAGLFYASRATFSGGRQIKPWYFVVGAVVAVGSVLITGTLLPNFAPETFEEEALTAQAVGARTHGGSNYTVGGGSLWMQLPLAVATVLYRPLVFEASNLLVFSNALEMLGALILTVRAISRSSFGKTVRYVLERPALCFCFGFVLTLSVGVGLTTTNMGTLSRYRMPLVPFYATLLVVLASRPVERVSRGLVPLVTGGRARA